MSVSLSYILPVCNAEQTLEKQVQQLLDLLPDLTDRFELLVVDEGSTDHTGDVAHGLSRQFPQVRTMRCDGPSNRRSAASWDMDSLAGEVVIVHDADSPLRPSALREMICAVRQQNAEAARISGL